MSQWLKRNETIELTAYGIVGVSILGTFVLEHKFSRFSVGLLHKTGGSLLDWDEKMVQEEWRKIGGTTELDIFPVRAESNFGSAGRVLMFPYRFSTLGRARTDVAWKTAMGSEDDHSVDRTENVAKWGHHDLPVTAEETRVMLKSELLNIRHNLSFIEYEMQLGVLVSTSALCYVTRKWMVLPIVATLLTQRLCMRYSAGVVAEKLDAEERSILAKVLKREYEQNKMFNLFGGNDYFDFGRLWLSTRIKILENANLKMKN